MKSPVRMMGFTIVKPQPHTLDWSELDDSSARSVMAPTYSHRYYGTPKGILAAQEAFLQSQRDQDLFPDTVYPSAGRAGLMEHDPDELHPPQAVQLSLF